MSGEAAISEVLSRDLSDIHNADTTKLAYIGDAVYEVYVRLKSAEACGRHAGEMNKYTVHYVRADSQAKAARGMLRDIADNKEDVESGARLYRGRGGAFQARAESHQYGASPRMHTC